MTNEENIPDLSDDELRDALDAIELHGDAQLKAHLQQLERERRTASPPREAVVRQLPRRKINWLAIAAAIALLLAAGWFLLRPANALAPAELALNEFEPYPNIAVRLTKAADVPAGDADLLAAYAAYETGDWERAGNLLEALPETPVNKFYLAQTLLARERFPEASIFFFDVSTEPGFKLVREAEYYLALSLIGEDEIADARSLLEAIATDQKHPFQAKANDLLPQLK